jgi:two-component system capsular synthesis response regulator RcsB
MIQKVLIAEDHENASISLQITLPNLGITTIDTVAYCDEALTRIESSLHQNIPYDLLITDLHFVPDHRQQKISGGINLINAARKVQPGLQILVFSAEGSPVIIKSLFDKNEIDGYVRKARRDTEELKIAIQTIKQNQRYIPQELINIMRQQNSFQFTDHDLTIIKLLANGTPQKNIPDFLKKNNIRPTGLSSVEKRLNLMRETLKMSKNEQLVSFCKDMGLI